MIEPAALFVPAGAVLLTGGGLWALRRRLPQGSPYALGIEGAVLAAALAAGVILTRGWNGLPPGNVNDWPGILALAAAGLALAAHAPWRVFAPLALVFVAVAAPLILKIPLATWSAGEAAVWLPAIGVPWLLLICAARGTAERLPPAALPAWGAALAAAAAIAANAGSSSTAQHLGGAAAAAGTLALVRLLAGDALRPASAAVALAAIAPLWWLLAQTSTDGIPMTALVPLAVAPLAAWAAWPLRHRPWPAAILAALIAGGVAAAAMALTTPPPPAPVGW